MPRLLPILLGLLAATAAAQPVDFNRDVRPILADRCFPCHGPDAAARQAGLRFDVGVPAGESGPAIVPGDPAASLVMRRVRAPDPAERMPPVEAKLTLAAAEIAVLERWIAQGARRERHWAFVAPRPVEPPPVADGSWPRDPLDRFVLARLEGEGARPAAEADRETLLRRASFDLTGLPPDAATAASFLADEAPGAFERLVDRLLASPHFGEHLASAWLDVARYADTHGYQNDRYRAVWAYRDWVVRAFNDDLPWDEFLTWQLAGDLLPGATHDQRLATAFNRLHRQTNEGGSVEEEFRVEYVSDRVHTFGTAFLGLTLECARCHDHRFDPISQREYYELSSYFANIDESGLYSHFTDATPTPALALPTAEQRAKLVDLERRVAEAEGLLSEARGAGREAFERWSPTSADGAGPLIADEVGHFPLDAIVDGKNVPNLIDPKKPGGVVDVPEPTSGAWGGALLLDGESNVHFPGVGEFRRSDPFTVSLWIRVPAPMERAVVLHRSRAWTDAASQGFELLVEEGCLTWSLIHFWPGNAVSIRSRSPVPVGRWVHVVGMHDGSARAAGLGLFVDGVAAAVEVVRDGLTRSITGGGSLVLTLGQRFRDRGFKGGGVDELRVFGRALCSIEIAQLYDQKTLRHLLERAPDPGDAAGRESLLAWFLANRHEPTRVRSAELRQRRSALARARDAVPEIMTMRELAEPRPVYVLERGAYDAPRDRVSARTPLALAIPDRSIPADRLALARWLCDPRHPLTARVAVNRLWQLVFGRGLVPTSENFGLQGTPPTHPRLLDWLARELVSSGWDTKALVRRLVTSATWRQSSRRGDALAARDPENLLWGRALARRLTAEMLRDQALCAGGLLVRELGGPPVRPYQPPGLWKEKSGQTYQRDRGPGLYRRSLYTIWKRTSPPPTMMIFDAAKRDVCIARRHETTTPLQSLVLLNDPQFVEAARALAQRVMHEREADEERIILAFSSLATRGPRSSELAVLGALLSDQRAVYGADPDAARCLVAVGDAEVDADLDTVELAATTVLCSTIMSYDATLMRR